MFLSQGSGLTFLVGESVFRMVLYLTSAYLSLRAWKYRAVVMLIAGANAARVAPTIVDPYGVLGPRHDFGTCVATNRHLPSRPPGLLPGRR
jgi:hypothetical protein